MSRLASSFLGSTTQKQTWLHRLNPALKVGCSIFLLVMIFLPTGFITQLLLLIVIIGMLASARISKGSILAILKTILVIFVITFLISWLAAKDPHVILDLEHKRMLWGFDWEKLFSWGWIYKYNAPANIYWYHGQIWGGWVGSLQSFEPSTGTYYEYVVNGLHYYLPYYAPVYSLSSHTLITNISVMIKLFMMLSIFSLQVNTTTTMGLSYGIETILTPLKFIKVPTTQIGMVIAIALKFVPNLLAQANMVIKAQACRGVDLRHGNLKDKVQALCGCVVPMFSIAFNQADYLADSMEARNYDPKVKRTRYRKYQVKWYEWVGFALIVLLFILLVIMTAWKVIIGPFALIDLHMVV